MCNILQIMFQPKLSDGMLYFVNFCKNDGLCELQGDRSCPLHSSVPTPTLAPATYGLHECHTLCALWAAYGSQAATRESFDTRNETIYLLQDHCSSLTARIYTLVLKWMPPIHSIKSIWFCPLEIEFVISCPELSPCTVSVTRLRKTEFISSAVRDGLTCVKSKLFLCEVVMKL